MKLQIVIKVNDSSSNLSRVYFFNKCNHFIKHPAIDDTKSIQIYLPLYPKHTKNPQRQGEFQGYFCPRNIHYISTSESYEKHVTRHVYSDTQCLHFVSAMNFHCHSFCWPFCSLNLIMKLMKGKRLKCSTFIKIFQITHTCFIQSEY